LIRVQNLSLHYGERSLFDDVSFTITAGEKLAITGRNGSGKSTLFKILTGEIRPDTGVIEKPKELTVGTLRQELPPDEGRSVREEVMRAIEEIHQLQTVLHELEQTLSSPELAEKAMIEAVERMHEVHERLNYLNADKIEGEVEKILLGLGFQPVDLDRRTHEFSGGWRMRIELAKLLLQKPDVLLLDEPNNHLDILSIQWLEKYLAGYEGTVVMISHDLMLVDRVARRIIEVDRGRIYDFKGTYSDFVQYRLERKEIEQNEYNAQQRLIQHKEALIDKFRAKANKASFAKSLQSELARMDMIDEPESEQEVMRLRFTACRPSGRMVVETHHVCKDYGELKVLNDIELHIERGQKLSFIGQNGQGKSTMVKLISGAIAPSSGTIKPGHQVKFGYYAQEHSELLDPKDTVMDAVEHAAVPEARPNIRKILGSLGFRGEDIDKKISVLSGGEKSRVRLAMLLVQEHNVLILDEPTHHLDIPSKEVLKDAIVNYAGTVIIVSHDRDFLRGLAEKTFYFANAKIREFLGDIDYFLEKTNSDSLAETFREQVKKKATEQNSDSVNNDQLKKLKRKIELLELEISKLEKRRDEIQNQMADLNFYSRHDHASVVNEYEDIQVQLKQKVADWENAMMSAEAL